MRSTAENQIKILSRKIMHTVFVENRLDYVFSLLSPDIYYLGSGKNMQAEGKKKVEFFLNKAYRNFFPYTITQEKYLAKRIGWHHWLCEAIVDMTMETTGAKPHSECRHETFLFRRVKDAKPGEWELVHVHTSVASDRVSPEEMLAIQQANRTRRNTHLYDGLTEREKKLVQMLRSGMQIRDIAAAFGLAEITIKKALAKLYHRYNVKNRSRLCAYFDVQENNF